MEEAANGEEQRILSIRIVHCREMRSNTCRASSEAANAFFKGGYLEHFSHRDGHCTCIVSMVRTFGDCNWNSLSCTLPRCQASFPGAFLKIFCACALLAAVDLWLNLGIVWNVRGWPTFPAAVWLLLMVCTHYILYRIVRFVLEKVASVTSGQQRTACLLVSL